MQPGDNDYTEETGDKIIILKLTLLTATKQLAKIEDYMTVRSKSLENLGGSNDGERARLYYILQTELGSLESDADYEPTRTVKYIALLNVLFNKISSPFTKFKNIRQIQDEGEELVATAPRTLYENRPSSADKMDALIRLALSGYDVTKEYTVIGATAYFRNDERYGTGDGGRRAEVSEETIDKLKEKRDSLNLMMPIDDRLYGLPEDEYSKYLGDMLEKKLNEVIYELNIDKYVKGYQEYEEEVLPKYEPAKEYIIGYYTRGEFLTDCGGITPDSLKVVTNMTKSGVVHDKNAQQTVNTNQQSNNTDPGDETDAAAATPTVATTPTETETPQEEEEETQVLSIDITPEGVTTNSINAGQEREIVDEFVLTANSNYIVKWTFTYTVDAEGKFISNVVATYKPVRNY